MTHILPQQRHIHVLHLRVDACSGKQLKVPQQSLHFILLCCKRFDRQRALCSLSTECGRTLQNDEQAPEKSRKNATNPRPLCSNNIFGSCAHTEPRRHAESCFVISESSRCIARSFASWWNVEGRLASILSKDDPCGKIKKAT